MQFKPIAVITVLLLVVASLLVAGCTSSTNSDQATSSASQSASSTATKTATITTKAAASAPVKPSASASIIIPTPKPTLTPTPVPVTPRTPTIIYQLIRQNTVHQFNHTQSVGASFVIETTNKVQVNGLTVNIYVDGRPAGQTTSVYGPIGGGVWTSGLLGVNVGVLSVGTHQITVVFPGNSQYEASSGSGNVLVTA
jgi:hypothetical protein